MDFRNFSATVGGNTSKTLPEITISLQVTDSNTGAILVDYTGANSFSLWTAFASLSATDKRDVLDQFVRLVIRKKAGL